MRKIKFFSAVLSLFLLVPASITWAQTISSQKGLTTAVFNLPAGTIKVRLPEDIRPGDIISGSFVVEPSGKNDKQKQKALDELLKYELKIGDPDNSAQVAQSLLSRYKDAAGRLQQITTSIPFAVSLIDPKKQIVSVPVNIRLIDPHPLNLGAGCQIPSHALAGSMMRITGFFDGDAANTKCMMGSTELAIIAESPGQCIISLPTNATGTQTLTVKEYNQQQCTNRFTGVQMDVSAGKLNLQKGEKTYIDVSITGLQSLPDTAVLSLDNITTGVVTMQPSNNVVIPLPPDSVGSGTFKRRFDIQSSRTGSFTVNVNLDLPEIVYDIQPLQFSMFQNPGSWGWRGDDPCEREGPIVWRWHRTLPCAVELKVTPYGTTPGEKEVIDYIIEKLKELSKKGGDLGDKMGKCFSFRDKVFSMFARCYRDWDEWDVTYKCVNGVWVQTSMEHTGSGRDNLSGWIALRNAGGNNEWFKSDPWEWLAEAIAKAVTCCD